MYHFLIFILLVIFAYEFIKRIKYLEEPQKSYETFRNPEEKYTYLANNFSDESYRMLDPPSYIKDVKKEDTNINQVVSATYPEEPDNFFEGLPVNSLKEDRIRDTCQRPWQICKMDLTPLLEQRKRSKEARKKDDLKLYY